MKPGFCTGFGFGDDEYCYGHGADNGLSRFRQLTDQDSTASKHRGGDGSLSQVDSDNGQQYGDGSGGLGRRRGTGGDGGREGDHGEGEGGDGDGRNRRLGRDHANKVCTVFEVEIFPGFMGQSKAIKISTMEWFNQVLDIRCGCITAQSSAKHCFVQYLPLKY